MDLLVRLRSLCRNLFRGVRVERDLDAELRGYLDLLADEKMAQGVPADRARREAHLELGGVEQVKEEVRSIRTGVLLEQAAQDARYALRGLRRAPVFATAAIVTLSLGIGANTAMFSVIDGLLFRPLPVPDPGRLIALYRGESGTEAAFSFPDFERLAAAAGSAPPASSPADAALNHPPSGSRPLRGLAAWATNVAWMRAADELHRITLHVVSPNYFEVLGVRPVLGRAFATHDATASRGTAVISQRLWRERLGGEAGILGRTVRLGGETMAIIGVAPEAFNGLQPSAPTDAWITFATLTSLEPGWNFRDPREIWIRLIGRLQPDVTIHAAEAALRALPPASGSDSTPDLRVVSAATTIFDPDARESASRLSLLVGGVAAFVLLIACANVANLLMVRAAARRRELGVRLAVGASRSRILRQMIVESLVLCAAGGLGGLLLADWTVQAVVAFAPASAIPPGVTVAMDMRIIVFAAMLSLLTALLFSIVPAWHVSGTNLIAVVKPAPEDGVGRSALLLRRGLVIAQVALSAVLIAGAGLFVRTLVATLSVPSGYDVDRVVVSAVDFSVAKLPPAAVRTAGEQIRERVAALPEVESVAFGQIVPFSGAFVARPAIPAGESLDRAREDEFLVPYAVVSEGFFETLGMPLRGRDFTSADGDSAPRVVVVNETLAKRYWQGQNAIGQRLSLPAGKGPAVSHEVIGVVPDSKYVSLTERQHPFMYLPWTQNHRPRMTLHVRTRTAAAALSRSVRSAVADVNRDLPAMEAMRLRDYVDRSLAQSRVVARLLMLFGGIALAVAAVGVYGLTAYTVFRRTKEVGVRIALGARPRDIVRMLVGQSAVLVIAGLLAGTAGALLLARLVRTMLFGVAPADPLTFAGASLLLVVTMLAATVIPARRAARVDPLAALRVD